MVTDSWNQKHFIIAVAEVVVIAEMDHLVNQEDYYYLHSIIKALDLM